MDSEKQTSESETAVVRGEIIQVTPHMIRPVVKVEEALEAWNEYQGLKTKLASDGDFVNIQGKMHPTKQFANKLSKFFGLSIEIKRAEKELKEDGFIWHIWARATAPNGQYRDSDGHCSSTERNFSHVDHDVYATAVTRAKNRAILEIAGFGEVSKEEILDDQASAIKPVAPTQDGPITETQVNSVADLTSDLSQIEGKEEGVIWFKLVENVKKNYGGKVIESITDLSEKQAERTIAWLKGWKRKAEERRDAVGAYK